MNSWPWTVLGLGNGRGNGRCKFNSSTKVLWSSALPAASHRLDRLTKYKARLSIRIRTRQQEDQWRSTSGGRRGGTGETGKIKAQQHFRFLTELISVVMRLSQDVSRTTRCNFWRLRILKCCVCVCMFERGWHLAVGVGRSKNNDANTSDSTVRITNGHIYVRRNERGRHSPHKRDKDSFGLESRSSRITSGM